MLDNDFPVGTKMCQYCEGEGTQTTGTGDNFHEYECRNCDGNGYVDDDDYEEPIIHAKRCPQCGEGSDHYTIAGVCFECGYES